MTLIVGAIVWSIVVFLLSAYVADKWWQRILVKRGYGECNATTGAWQWKEKQ